MGAAWIKTTAHIPVLIPPFKFNDIKGVIPQTHGIMLDETHGLNSLKVKIEELFAITPDNNPSIWERRRDGILKQIKAAIPKENINDGQSISNLLR